LYKVSVSTFALYIITSLQIHFFVLRPTVLMEIFHNCPQFFQSNAGIDT
jgi:hypothetical protein